MPAAIASREPDPRRWIALFAALTAPFLGVLDFFVVNLALPQIGERLGATFADQQLVIAAYATSYAVFVVTGGRLGDTYGRRRMFLLGLFGFVVASLLCALAPDPWSLIAARFAQGAAAAFAFPQVLALVHVTFPEHERQKALAFFGLNVALASMAGQLLGGLLVSWNPFDLGWRVLFLINLPIGAVALAISARTLPETRAERPPTLDWGGVLLATLVLASVIVPLIEGHHAGWPPWAVVLLALSVPLTFWFVRAERRSARAGRDPVIDVRLFGLQSFRRGLVMIVAYFFGGGSLFLVLSLYEQRGLGLDTLASALTFTSFAIGLLVSSTIATRHAGRAPGRFLHVGMALVCLGIGALVVGFALAKDGDARAAIQVGLAIYGLGQGAAMPVMFSSVIAQVPHPSAGAASGVLATCQQVSAALGVAVIGLVFSSLLAKRAGAIAHAEAATWALCVNLASMLLAALLARRLLHGSAPTEPAARVSSSGRASRSPGSRS